MVCEGQSGDSSVGLLRCYSDTYRHFHSHEWCTHGRKWGGLEGIVPKVSSALQTQAGPGAGSGGS